MARRAVRHKQLHQKLKIVRVIESGGGWIELLHPNVFQAVTQNQLPSFAILTINRN